MVFTWYGGENNRKLFEINVRGSLPELVSLESILEFSNMSSVVSY